MRWYEEGKDPDYRFSLANERTFLAWIRTALAILAGAIVLKQFAAHLQPAGLWLWTALGLAVLAGAIGCSAYFRWRGNEHAMRLEKSLPRSLMLPILAGALAMVAGMTALLAFWPW